MTVIARCDRCGYNRHESASVKFPVVRSLGTPTPGRPGPCEDCLAWADAAYDHDPHAMNETLPSIVDEFTCAGGVLRDDCPHCHGSGSVCEEHPDRPWYPTTSLEDGACDCGAPGMPCKDGPAFEEDLP